MTFAERYVCLVARLESRDELRDERGKLSRMRARASPECEFGRVQEVHASTQALLVAHVALHGSPRKSRDLA